MPERKCHTCKHYEPSPIRRMGWCRNPLLYTPSQSHLVDQSDLDCGRGVGNYWEPIVPAARSEPLGPQGDGEQPRSIRPLRLFARQPQLAPAAAAAGGGVMASSTSGGSGGGSGGGYRPPSSSGSGSGQPPRSGSSGGAQPPSSGPPRPQSRSL